MFNTALTLFTGDNFQTAERHKELFESSEKLSDFGFNDQTRSCVVQGGSWVVYIDNHFKGSAAVLGPGRYDLEALRSLEMVHADGRGRISSVRSLPVPAPSPLILGFSESDYGGEMQEIKDELDLSGAALGSVLKFQNESWVPYQK